MRSLRSAQVTCPRSSKGPRPTIQESCLMPIQHLLNVKSHDPPCLYSKSFSAFNIDATSSKTLSVPILTVQCDFNGCQIGWFWKPMSLYSPVLLRGKFVLNYSSLKSIFLIGVNHSTSHTTLQSPFCCAWNNNDIYIWPPTLWANHPCHCGLDQGFCMVLNHIICKQNKRPEGPTI